jgi:peptidyl-prolyl cis-trans isomerase C
MNESNKKYVLAAVGYCFLGYLQLQPSAWAQTAASPPPASSAETPAPPTSQQAPVAVVNGKPITKQMLEVYERLQASARPGTPVNQAALVDNLVGLQLLSEEALKKGLDKDATVQAQLDFQRLNILASAVLRDLLQSHKFTDEEIKKEYDHVVSAAPQKEYKASHILVKTKEEAEDVIKQLDQGKPFADLAREKSTDTSAKEGGDLGWFVPEQMVDPFAETVQKLKKGSYTKTPVQTEYGWHVIKLEDVRANEPPPLESVKGQVENMLQSRLVSEHVAKLREQAKVEILQPPAPPPEATTEPGGAPEAGKTPQAETPAAQAPPKTEQK